MKKQKLAFGLESLKDSKFTPLSNAAMQNVTGGTIFGTDGGTTNGKQYHHDMVTIYLDGKIDREYMNANDSIAAPGDCDGSLTTKKK